MKKKCILKKNHVKKITSIKTQNKEIKMIKVIKKR